MNYTASLRLALAAAISAPLALLLAPSAQAQIFSENFNSVPNGGTFVTYNAPAAVGGFTLTAGSVDALVNTIFPAVAGQTTGTYLDLDGSTNNGGILSTTSLALQPGTVTLSFALAGSQRGDTNTVRVSLGSLYTEDFPLASAATFSTISRQIVVGSAQSAVLTFNHAVTPGDNIGLLLDDVTLTQTAVPEPGTALLLLPALSALPLLALRGRIGKRSAAQA